MPVITKYERGGSSEVIVVVFFGGREYRQLWDDQSARDALETAGRMED